jgi:hypothetical protein
VSQAGVVTRLAVRELWITFRLVVLLVAFVAVGAAVALLPAPLPLTMQRFAAGLGAATLLVGATAAWSIADERAHGRAGWLVTRSVSRGTFLRGWFVALTAIALVGLAAAAVLGWLAASGVSLRLDPVNYAALLAAVAATVTPAVALGLLCGTVFGPRVAAPVTIIISSALVAAAWLLPASGDLVPGAAFLELAALSEGTVALAAAWRAAGVSLLAAALLLGLARLALSRAEL